MGGGKKSGGKKGVEPGRQGAKGGDGEKGEGAGWMKKGGSGAKTGHAGKVSNPKGVTDMRRTKFTM